MASPPNRLCTACKKIDFEAMLAEEAPEQDMGLLSNYADPNCPFCKLIATAVSRAGWNFGTLCTPIDGETVPQVFIQSRSPLTVKKYSQGAHPEPRLQLALDRQPEGFQRGRPTVREIDRETNRFIIAELESLPNEGEKRLLQRRSVGDRVDAELVNSWLNECNMNHKHSKKSLKTRINDSLFLEERGFLLIDAIDMQLVRRTEPAEYVALSYIWGGVKPFLTTTKNISKLSSGPGALSPSNLAKLKEEGEEERQIPRTVLDAMEFTRQLGIRYTWVDHLCIPQDDKKEQARLIGRMDDIYDNAAITLLAGSGANSNTGLMGVSPRAEGLPIEKTTIVDDSYDEEVTFNLAICPPSLCEEIRRSAWNTRCWTYQEQCLSQRCVYFTPREMFFNCSEMQRREAYVLLPPTGVKPSDLQVRTGPAWWNRKYRQDLDPTPYRYMGDLMANRLSIREYQTAVQDYLPKELTFLGDIFNAFEGIYNRFSKGEKEILPIQQAQGIPVQFLWQGLLWFPAHTAKKRVAQADSPKYLPKTFSSWSWASWAGPVEFIFTESLWLSRNISQAVLKGKPVHAAVPCWYYPNSSSKRYPSCNAWKAAANAGPSCPEFYQTKLFLKDRLAVDTEILLRQSSSLLSDDTLKECNLGFFAAYISASAQDVELAMAPVKQGWRLRVGKHAGEFRYDSIDEKEKVGEFVLLIAAETITNPPDTVSILLGLVTRVGISRRVGLGYAIHTRGSELVGLQWGYKYFRVG